VKCTIQGSHELTRQGLAALVAGTKLATGGSAACSRTSPLGALSRLAGVAQGGRGFPRGRACGRGKGAIRIGRALGHRTSVAVELVCRVGGMGVGRVPSQTASVFWAHLGDGFGALVDAALEIRMRNPIQRCSSRIDGGQISGVAAREGWLLRAVLRQA
jgi:hypothetical protein